jgi:hypothetical protein
MLSLKEATEIIFHNQATGSKMDFVIGDRGMFGLRPMHTSPNIGTPIQKWRAIVASPRGLLPVFRFIFVRWRQCRSVVRVARVNGVRLSVTGRNDHSHRATNFSVVAGQ